jgi:thymidylate synthase (FAD)
MKVELIDHMGSDLSVCNAARVSFSKISECLSDKDEKLINYLAKHNHWTPFGHCSASFRIKTPLFVARQLGKHQVGLVWNEVSRRYVDDEPEFYTPKTWRKRAEDVKQGSSDEECFMAKASDHKVYTASEGWQTVETMDYAEHALAAYKALLDAGVCPEQARMILPQSMYTEFIWSGSLAAFARVCKLRLDPHTQLETRLVAEMIDTEMERLFPISWKALRGGTK